LPFSAGPRLCLGHSFALLELKLTVARIMQRFRLNVVPGSTIDAVVQLTLRPREGIPMTVHKQDGNFAAGSITGNIHRMVDLRS
jgi:cytochrome P450